jgi:hypothetical protein
VSQHCQGDSQSGKPHEREHPSEEQAPKQEQHERASAADGYVHQQAGEGALRLMIR